MARSRPPSSFDFGLLRERRAGDYLTRMTAVAPSDSDATPGWRAEERSSHAQTDEDILNPTVSDEAIEAAGTAITDSIVPGVGGCFVPSMGGCMTQGWCAPPPRQ
jgi:hypothetical protein